MPSQNENGYEHTADGGFLMMDLRGIISEMQAKGYKPDDAEARVCQDIILKAISQSPLSRNITVKGGVVMRSMTQNVRRATQDMDIDFIRYSLSDESISRFISSINCLDGIQIEKTGRIVELNQQDYNGKRVFILITDKHGNRIESKIDFGVHKHIEIEQKEYCFDIGFDDEGASLLINTREQMFSEKLRSLLKFGPFSTRYKDIYDMYYQCGKMDGEKLRQCIHIFILNDPGMREASKNDIIRRVQYTFSNSGFRQRVDASDKRWLDDDISHILETIIHFLQMLDL